MRSSTVVRIASLICLLAGACRKDQAARPCGSDRDCKGDRVCQAGDCVSPPAPRAASPPPPTPVCLSRREASLLIDARSIETPVCAGSHARVDTDDDAYLLRHAGGAWAAIDIPIEVACNCIPEEDARELCPEWIAPLEPDPPIGPTCPSEAEWTRRLDARRALVPCRSGWACARPIGAAASDLELAPYLYHFEDGDWALVGMSDMVANACNAAPYALHRLLGAEEL
jgi:hypothetical protein